MRPQFGSAPAIAVFTSGLSAIVLPICRASARVRQPWTSTVIRCVAPFAVGGNRLGQVLADFEQRGAEVVERFAGERGRGRGRPGSLGCAPLASSSTVSLVLMWPSTLMQWNDSSTASTRAAWASCLPQRGVGHHQREHRGHVGADHRGPLGHAGDARRHAADRAPPGRGAWAPCRSSSCRGRRFRATAHRRRAAAAAAWMPARIFSIGSIAPMTPVDITSACSGLRAAGLGRPGRHLPRVGVALVAGAGVGLARVDRHARGSNRSAFARGRASPARRRPGSWCTRPPRRPADRRRPATDRASSCCA